MTKGKRVTLWVAAPPETMAIMQKRLYTEWPETLDLVVAGVQEDRSRGSKELDNEAFLQAYIEGVADVLFEHIMAGQDRSRTASCPVIPWPSLWMTKIIDTVKDESPDYPVDSLITETNYGIHQIAIQPAQLANNAATQILAPVSVGAIQAGLAYLKLAVPESVKEVHRELYMDAAQAYDVLDSFRTHHASMLSTIMSMPPLSVISPHAIHP